ncbi:MAG TPA: Gfo/Idh/MocA family oxidoreductase [Candidatus Acidoferrales bacterium]|jgi:UDP-N-acetyl-2-amino-2-deoxyglucuronate dehydrogenase|nr:Gfo/Idh/MocA family oxidoreductase [Candidatus Acidoferrales bacterium]
MRVGMIGTGAISNMHARAYKNIGFQLTVCTDINQAYGRKFAEQHGCEFVSTYEEVCRHPKVDYVDVCTFPDFRLQPIEICAQTGKHVQVQKPVSTSLETARQMIETARRGGILLGVVSQHRFDDSSLFLSKAIAHGRLGKLLQCDCYVKWYRSPQYYSRPIKGSWQTEGGGALINQAIHGIDILRWIAGPLKQVFGMWQLGALHKIESEDVVNAVMHFANGATGVVQAATAFWPGYTERTEFHGTKGTAIISGDKLTAWDVENDAGEPAPVSKDVASGASDPMAISVEPFERQFLDFADAIAKGRKPLVAGEEGYQALEVVDAIYRSCRTGAKVDL